MRGISAAIRVTTSLCGAGATPRRPAVRCHSISSLTVRRKSTPPAVPIKPTVTVRAYLTVIVHNHGFRSSHECADPRGSGPRPGIGGAAITRSCPSGIVTERPRVGSDPGLDRPRRARDRTQCLLPAKLGDTGLAPRTRTQRRIVDAAELADAHGFISNLPRGYEQEVGERGTGLSGGQVQRLCIARALYGDPRILILDEATSSLDTESESNILSNMDGILEGRTALVIAHRLSTIMRADKILVLYNGAIAESGTHDELIAAKGMYYQLVQKQITV